MKASDHAELKPVATSVTCRGVRVVTAGARAWPGQGEHADVMLYDPVPMKLARRANLERAQLLIESPSRRALQIFLAEWGVALDAIKTPSRLRWHLEVDPLEF